MTLSDKTKIGLTFGQLFTIISIVFVVGGSITIHSTNTTRIDERTKQDVIRLDSRIDVNCKEIKELKSQTDNDRALMLKLIQDIRESQIRIEGKLDLKQDRYQ